jgi:hypothetical protein
MPVFYFFDGFHHNVISATCKVKGFTRQYDFTIELQLAFIFIISFHLM